MAVAFVVTFLTPLAALAIAGALIPLAAFALASRRVARVRARLRLPAPSRANRRAVAAALVVALLGVAAAQPTARTGATMRARTDVGVLFVLDTSRSMAASTGKNGASRLQRAVVAARRLRQSIPGIPAGIATLTDRVVPNLLPVTDRDTFDATLRQSIGIEEPKPLEVNKRATIYGALTQIPNGNYFTASVKRPIAVLLTDGETRGIDTAQIAKAFRRRPATKLIAIQFWRSKELVYGKRGIPEADYVPDPTSRELLRSVVGAAKGELFTEGQAGSAEQALHRAVGSGPLRSVLGPERVHPLAPYVALAALLPLAFVFLPGVPRLPRRPSPEREVQEESSSTWARRIRAASTNPSRS